MTKKKSLQIAYSIFYLVCAGIMLLVTAYTMSRNAIAIDMGKLVDITVNHTIQRLLWLSLFLSIGVCILSFFNLILGWFFIKTKVRFALSILLLAMLICFGSYANAKAHANIPREINISTQGGTAEFNLDELLLLQDSGSVILYVKRDDWPSAKK